MQRLYVVNILIRVHSCDSWLKKTHASKVDFETINQSLRCGKWASKILMTLASKNILFHFPLKSAKVQFPMRLFELAGIVQL